MFGGDKPRVVVYDEGFALVTFSDFFVAFVAQASLNDHFLPKNNARLVVKWVPKELP